MTESITSLGKSEDWFWNTEMRIVWNLIEEHKKLEKIRQKNLAIYIACYVWGKEPHDDEPVNDLRIGVDVPADPALIDRLF